MSESSFIPSKQVCQKTPFSEWPKIQVGELSITTDPDAAGRDLFALLDGNEDLLLEVGPLFLVENPRYEPRALFNYLFVLAPTPADDAGCQYLAFRPREKDEREAVLAAPERFGLVARHVG